MAAIMTSFIGQVFPDFGSYSMFIYMCYGVSLSAVCVLTGISVYRLRRLRHVLAKYQKTPPAP